MQTARFAVLLAAAWLAAVQPALAQDARSRQAAAEAYDQGTAAYLAGEYEKAAEWFETANRLAPAAPALIQAARSLQEAGLKARAASIALRLTTEYTNDAAVMQFGQEMLDRFADQLLRVEVSCDGCTLDVDGSLQEWSAFFVTPDEAHVVTASFETGDKKVEISGGASETKTLAFEAPPPQPSDDTPPEAVPGANGRDAAPIDGEEKKPLPPLVTYIGAGVTVALAAGSIISTLDMNSGVDPYKDAVAEYNAMCDPVPAGQQAHCNDLFDDAEGKLDDGQAKETRTTVLWVATGVVGAATLVAALLFTNWEGDGEASDARRPGLDFALAPGVRETSVIVKGRF